MFLEQVQSLAARGRLFARVALEAGFVQNAHPRGLLHAARSLVRGASGPATIFRVHGASIPDRPALVYEGVTRTYGAMDQEIDRLAGALRSLGFRRGDSAVSMQHNRPEVLLVGCALARLGTAGVSASWRSTPSELAYLVNHSGSRALFFDAELWPTVEAAKAKFERVKDDGLFCIAGTVPGVRSLEELLSSPGATGPEEEGAVVIYTSGTTGKPKGAVRRFGRGQLLGFFAFLDASPLRNDERHLCVCPLYHSTGLGFLGLSLLVGGTGYIAKEFDPEQFLATIERERITSTAVVPTLLHRLMALPDESFKRRDLSSLRAVFCGGAQLPGPLALRAMELLGPVLYNFYGATETGLVTLATPQDLYAAPGTIGRPLEGVEIRLLDEDGRLVKAGAVGELFTRNSMLVDGYHADDEATRSSMREGFFSVGDLAICDEAGRYHIVGRKRDMVISGGVNIYPAELEATFAEHPSVAQVAVIGIPDPEWGERLRAFIVRKPGTALTPQELRSFGRERLSGPKIPREWVFLDALPSNPTGKILKRELRDWDGAVERC